MTLKYLMEAFEKQAVALQAANEKLNKLREVLDWEGAQHESADYAQEGGV